MGKFLNKYTNNKYEKIQEKLSLYVKDMSYKEVSIFLKEKFDYSWTSMDSTFKPMNMRQVFYKIIQDKYIEDEKIIKEKEILEKQEAAEKENELMWQKAEELLK